MALSQSTPPHRDPALRIAATPADANVYGSIFGGWLLSLMDAGAGLIAARFARGRTATVAVDRIELTAPTQVGDEVSVYGSVTSFRRSSFVVSVEAWRRDRQEGRHIQGGRGRVHLRRAGRKWTAPPPGRDHGGKRQRVNSIAPSGSR